jgi:hypothetical protein
MKIFIIIVLFFIVIAQATSQTIYSNQYGQPIGSSTTIGNTTYFSNQYGQPVGTATAPTPTYTPPMPRSPSVAAPIAPMMPSLPMMPVMPMMPSLPMMPTFPVIR